MATVKDQNQMQRKARAKARAKVADRRAFQEQCRRLKLLVKQLEQRAPHDPDAAQALARIARLLETARPHVKTLRQNAERRLEELARYRSGQLPAATAGRYV